MDEFLKPSWDLEQVFAWAETRMRDAVSFAAEPWLGKPFGHKEIEDWCATQAAYLAQDNHDIQAELWAASGWTPTTKKFDPPRWARDFADEQRIPVYLVSFDKDVYVVGPKPPEKDRLPELLKISLNREVRLINDLVATYCDKTDGIESDTRLEQLSPQLRDALVNYFSAEETRSRPRVFVRQAFPTTRYLKHLFENGALLALVEPKDYELTKSDWTGLQIAVGGDKRRLGVVIATGESDFERVRVEREAVLREFPEEPPLDEKRGLTKPAKKGGRPPALDWTVVKEEALGLMDYHGEFGADSPKWNAQAKLEDELEAFCETKFEKRPGRSTLQGRVALWLLEWRNSKIQCPET
jgi:hypothetical protein